MSKLSDQVAASTSRLINMAKASGNADIKHAAQSLERTNAENSKSWNGRIDKWQKAPWFVPVFLCVLGLALVSLADLVKWVIF